MIPGLTNNEDPVNSIRMNNDDGNNEEAYTTFVETTILEEAQVSVNDRPEFLDDEDESDEDNFVVTIGEIKTNLPFNKPKATGASGTIDLDANPTLKDGTPIYDLDLATMEDKPWRKPGADITDYFNYGFNEETWNQYCERQRKFRTEFGTDQGAINKAILSNIQLTGPTQVLPSIFPGGRQLVNLAGGLDTKSQQQKPQKIVVDLSKPPPSIIGSSITGSDHLLTSVSTTVPVIRTVINESGIVTKQESSSNFLSSFKMEMESTNTVITAQESHNTPVDSPVVKTPPPIAISSTTNVPPPQPPQNIETIDFTKPPPFGGTPIFDPVVPPPSVTQLPTQPASSLPQTLQTLPPSQTVQPQLPRTTSVPTNLDLPPGIEESDGPPGVLDGPPGISDMPPGISRINFTQPPPISQFSYNPSPHSFANPPSSFAPGLSHQQPSQFGGHSRPNPLFQPSYRHPFGGFGGGRFHERIRIGRGPPRIEDRSSDSETESGFTRRKRRRSRTKSRSPSDSRRHKDEKRKDRDHKDKDGKKKKEKEKEKKDKHKSHRSPSAKKEKTIKRERSDDREKESEKESSSRRRSSPSNRKREKESSGNRVEINKVKLERKTPEKE